MRNGIREEITGFRNQIGVFVGLGASTVENRVIVILLIISNMLTDPRGVCRLWHPMIYYLNVVTE